ncbi:P-loop containing nucleoside triphosphate hydrolase protein [Paraphysoderma sedebokerense]|nr:P-loop containing nucleoside triphosphate hydrolase protein [Paraphysoderma sedebokerense]
MSRSASDLAISSATTSRSGSPKMNRKLDIKEELAKRSKERESLNLVVVGHVDAGKSTLMGHLLYDIGEVQDKAMRKYERDSQKVGKGSFAYAWVLDETEEERSRGITIDVAVTTFVTPHRKFTLMDAPGHRDFIPNMISGAAQADVAILVVDSSPGEFEAGFESNGQTKEHALLIRSLGVKEVCVAINKLDMMNWSEARYEEIVSKLIAFLVQAGFKKDKLYFVPTSGLTGENLMKCTETDLKQWYKGKTLYDTIDNFEVPQRPVDKPFRLSIVDFYKGGASGGSVTIIGRVDSGYFQVGETLTVMPLGESGVVRSIELNDEIVKWAVAGDHVSVSVAGLDVIQLGIGHVLCPPSAPIPITNHIGARIVVFDVKIPVTLGFPVIFHHGSLTETANITKLIATLNKSTGEVLKKNPRCITKQSTAIVEIKLSRPICLELYQTSKELGRFMLRKGGETVAAGIVTEILNYHQPAGS